MEDMRTCKTSHFIKCDLLDKVTDFVSSPFGIASGKCKAVSFAPQVTVFCTSDEQLNFVLSPSTIFLWSFGFLLQQI